ncbi:hypothetical protein [Xanthomonas floridensis]|uniref:Outer membrane assembly lipoprotein YfiO n=1 Tax=Xanthomonas floridensis TaxID=1843580 RepID=A0A1A9MB23_9XANT|nr:hypothetical protein [Xanthomonas floridensis]MEA5123340.1 hypothetical protein [Xanthomonas floridensis]MEA5132693.1 hypothetical protein [Xanthomonas floridensis]OAG67734.1 hypothetical protein A7D17_16245 [Xanthomonas floridensis]
MDIGRFVPVRLVVLLLGACLAAPVFASSDSGCDASLSLALGDYAGCQNTVALTPGSDTRVNLLLLLRDGQPSVVAPTTALEPVFTWEEIAQALTPPAPDGAAAINTLGGEANRCNSQERGRLAFADALNANARVSAADKARLLAALPAQCPQSDGVLAPVEATSAAGKAFAHYLQAASAFYAAAFEPAAQGFAGLDKADDPWLRETALYMRGRVALNAAQVDGFDEYGVQRDPPQFDTAQLARAEQSFAQYLRDYPQGRYAASARGLMRRVYWLGGNTGKLEAEYARLLRLPAAQRGLSDVELAQEIDNKLLATTGPAALATPLLLAVADLRAMRYGADSTQGLTLDALQAQRARFADEPALFALLLASYQYYVVHRPAQVVQMVDAGKAPAGRASVAFTTAMLKGLALEDTGAPDLAAYWRRVLDAAEPAVQQPLAQLALARRLERDRALDQVFAAGSPITHAGIRGQLLVHAAGAELLRRQASSPSVTASERQLAAFVLLYKDLTRGQAGAFLQDRNLLAKLPPAAAAVPDVARTTYIWWLPTQSPLAAFSGSADEGGQGCPAIEAVAKVLATTPADAHAQLCVADFIRARDWDNLPINQPPSASELGGAPSQFPGGAYFRLPVYRRIIDAPHVADDDRAHALNRAISCYASSGYNHCGGESVPVAERKRWFLRLKREFPSSRWAQDLKYYW